MTSIAILRIMRLPTRRLRDRTEFPKLNTMPSGLNRPGIGLSDS
jgi:hypothetical protein